MHGRNNRKVSLWFGSVRCYYPDPATSLACQIRCRTLEDDITIVHVGPSNPNIRDKVEFWREVGNNNGDEMYEPGSYG